MPSCTATDLSPNMAPPSTPLMMSARSLASPGECWRERYCEEVEQGRPRCPRGRCRAGGTEHDKVPCPDHERPFGRDLAPGGSAGAVKKPRRRRRVSRKPAGTKPARKKISTRKPAKRAKKRK